MNMNMNMKININIIINIVISYYKRIKGWSISVALRRDLCKNKGQDTGRPSSKLMTENQ